MISLSPLFLRAAAASALFFTGLPSTTSAQAPYPNRNITLVLPFAAGSGTAPSARSTISPANPQAGNDAF